jgi:hypothetical protein
MKHGKTAAYTILKNEHANIDRWLYYTRHFDYRVLLDTGSTDGSLEYLKELANKDPGMIMWQQKWPNWRFDVARVYNLSMVPKDVVWALSPDMDEYFSENTHDEMERIIDGVPKITNIACDRLDVYSRTVRVGPPNFIPTNKIHLRHKYTWKERVYEHLSWTGEGEELELYSDDIFLIHDQDFRKPDRSPLYVDLMEQEWAFDPTNTWNNWFLLYHYWKSQQLDKYIPVACNYVRYTVDKSASNKNFMDVAGDLRNLLVHSRDTLTDEQVNQIRLALFP